MDETRIARALLELVILVFSLCLHEFGHAYAAYRLGDPTAKMLGRLTLDPRAHVDPIGTILLPLVRFLYPNFFMFGWAKPVPVTVENFKNPKRDNALVAAAGPAMNLLLALVAMLALGFLGATGFGGFSEATQTTLFSFFHFFFWLNFGLAIFNLFPLYPLDGNWILKALLPNRLSYEYSRLDRYGIWIFLLAAVLFPSIFNLLFLPAVGGLFWLLNSLGLSQLADLLNLG
ncbi:MAG TPA: site-2 protease family protein [bacterium]|nr:site-2 protease family protein [bacterium]